MSDNDRRGIALGKLRTAIEDERDAAGEYQTAARVFELRSPIAQGDPNGYRRDLAFTARQYVEAQADTSNALNALAAI